jgi:hypothetical protein
MVIGGLNGTLNKVWSIAVISPFPGVTFCTHTLAMASGSMAELSQTLTLNLNVTHIVQWETSKTSKCACMTSIALCGPTSAQGAS